MPVLEQTPVAPTHIYLGVDGQARIEGTRIKVAFIVRYKKQGMTAEQVQEAHPQLSLAQIHAAFAYYYDHEQEFDQLLAEQDRATEETLRQIAAQPWRQELAERLRGTQQT